ncbi:MAG: hypothetical protein ACRD1H_03675 [Vicinamibacterales bacterium]
MLFFRSEGDIDGWCATTGEPRGETLPLRQVWELSQVWYGNRMDPAYRGRTIKQVVEIFNWVGLKSEFWRA